MNEEFYAIAKRHAARWLNGEEGLSAEPLTQIISEAVCEALESSELRARPRGGKRKGRPLRFGEPTVPVRVPVSKVEAVAALIDRGGRALPLFTMRKPEK